MHVVHLAMTEEKGARLGGKRPGRQLHTPLNSRWIATVHVVRLAMTGEKRRAGVVGHADAAAGWIATVHFVRLAMTGEKRDRHSIGESSRAF